MAVIQRTPEEANALVLAAWEADGVDLLPLPTGEDVSQDLELVMGMCISLTASGIVCSVIWISHCAAAVSQRHKTWARTADYIKWPTWLGIPENENRVKVFFLT